MSGNGSKKRSRARAIQVASLKKQGFSAREIAECVGIKPEQVKALALLGKRLESLDAN